MQMFQECFIWWSSPSRTSKSLSLTFYPEYQLKSMLYYFFWQMDPLQQVKEREREKINIEERVRNREVERER